MSLRLGSQLGEFDELGRLLQSQSEMSLGDVQVGSLRTTSNDSFFFGHGTVRHGVFLADRKMICFEWSLEKVWKLFM